MTDVYFTMLPFRALHDKKLRRRDLVTLGALCSFRDSATGKCFPSHEKIAERAGFAVSTVRGSLSHLKESGYVDWVHHALPSGGWGTNDYLVHYQDPLHTVEHPPDTQCVDPPTHSEAEGRHTVDRTPDTVGGDKQNTLQNRVQNTPQKALQNTRLARIRERESFETTEAEIAYKRSLAKMFDIKEPVDAS